MQPSVRQTIIFAAAVCAVCSVLVSSAAVLLKDRQDTNKVLDQRKKVLLVAGLMTKDDNYPAERVNDLFTQNLETRIVDLETGEYVTDIDVDSFDQRKASKDPSRSESAPANAAKVRRVPNHAKVFLKMDGNDLDSVVIPIEGMGLWSTLYGYLALDGDTRTVDGLIFYEHGETPGLGGEVDNDRWKALWPGRKALDENFEPALRVIKGRAGTPQADPYQVDGLSGATITSNGVTNLLHFWLGQQGFGPYLERVRAEQGLSS